MTRCVTLCDFSGPGGLCRFCLAGPYKAGARRNCNGRRDCPHCGSVVRAVFRVALGSKPNPCGGQAREWWCRNCRDWVEPVSLALQSL